MIRKKERALKSLRKIVCLFISMVLLVSVFPIAFAAEGDNVEFHEAGITPDSVFYDMEMWWENYQVSRADSPDEIARLEATHAAERLAEMYEMVQEENYKAAEEAANQAKESMESYKEAIEEIGNEGSEESQSEAIIELEALIIENEQFSEAVHAELSENVEKGKISEKQAGEIINDVRTESSEIASVIGEEIIIKSAEEQGISKVEAEFQFEEIEKSEGVTDLQKKQISEEELTSLAIAIGQIEKEINEAKENGEDAISAEILLENAKLKLWQAESALKSGRFGEAYGQFTAAEHATFNIDRAISEGKISPQLMGPPVDWIEKEREKLNEGDSEDEGQRERIKADILRKYPEKKDEIEKRFNQEDKVKGLAEKVSEKLSEEAEKLKSEGKSDEEVSVFMAEKWSDEFRKAYGEPYIPPIFDFKKEMDKEVEGEEGVAEEGGSTEPVPEPIPIGFIDPEELIKQGIAEPAGGFLKDFEYTDPATDYVYSCGDSGCKYETPSGQEYEINYPEGYVPKTFEKGDEVHEAETITEEGTYKYEYSATGYEITLPDGSVEKHVYPQGNYEVVGGGKTAIKPTGFEVESKEGTTTPWEYNPQYRNYISPNVVSPN